FDAFAQDYARDPSDTLQRFVSLQAQGDTAARVVLRRLHDCVKQHRPDAAALAAGLQILKDTDLCDTLTQIDQPALILHGERDTVVPPAAGEYLHRELAGSQLHAVAGAAHAPFISQPEVVAHAIAEFCRG
ncbi:MAG: alpha/beta fold hydrolase, partial [Burkholderiales bacterium]